MLESNGSFWIFVAILFAVALLMCSIGFKKFVYFLSVGYGLSIFAIGLTLLIFAIGQFDFVGLKGNGVVDYILSFVLMLYGIRLVGFLSYREIKSASYRKTLENVSGKEEKKMPFFVKFIIWISVGVLYIMQTYPVIYRIGGSFPSVRTGLIAPVVGAVVALLGLTIEMTADLQKNGAKKKNPHSFVSTGLYAYVRCPNYLGEIIMWIGIFVSGVDIFMTDWISWLISVLGLLLIVYVMVSGAKRLELRQKKNYGSNPDYQKYIEKTPILSRIIPIKSFENWNWVK